MPQCELCPTRRKKNPVASYVYGTTDSPADRPDVEVAIVFHAPQKEDTDNNRGGVSYPQYKMIKLFCRWFTKFAVIYVESCTPLGDDDEEEESTVTAAKACSPRMLHDLQHIKSMLVIGQDANRALAGRKFDNTVGAPQYWAGRRYMATYDWRYVTLNPECKELLETDLSKFKRFHADRLQFQDIGTVHYNPENLTEIVDRFIASGLVVYDTETTIAPNILHNRLRQIGFYAPSLNEAFSVIYMPTDSEPHPNLPHATAEIKRLLSSDATFVGHNSGFFDHIIVSREFGVTPANIADTLIMHKAAWLEHKSHKLGFVARQYLDVGAWKADHAGNTAETDEQLVQYNLTDLKCTGDAYPLIVAKMESRAQRHIYEFDMRLQRLGVEMKYTGFRVNEDKRRAHVTRVTEKRDRHLAAFKAAAPHVNPRSAKQLGTWLFDELQIPALWRTASGEYQVNADVLRKICLDAFIAEDIKRVVTSLRMYKKAEKILNTYLPKYAPDSELLTNGCIYPNYGVDVARTGRFSSSDPSFMNVPAYLLDMFESAQDGNVLIGTDMDQIEIRMCADVAPLPKYKDVLINGGIDLHNFTSEMMFGESIWQAEGAPQDRNKKGSGRFAQIRGGGKTICFSSLYGGGPNMVYSIALRVEDEEGEFVLSHLTPKIIETAQRRWHRANPELRRWHQRVAEDVSRLGYIEEPVLGRRRYYAEWQQSAINFPIQSGAFTLVGQAMLRLHKRLPPGVTYANQLHDAIVLSCPQEMADDVRALVDEEFNFRFGDMNYTSSATIGINWKEVK